MNRVDSPSEMLARAWLGTRSSLVWRQWLGTRWLGTRSSLVWRQWLGAAVTLLAAYASLASSYSYTNEHVELPEQCFLLTPSAPTYSVRFRVETNQDRFSVKVSYESTSIPNSKIAIDSGEQGGHGPHIEDMFYEVQSQTEAALRLSVTTPACNHAFCSYEFAARVSAAITAAERGKLNVEVAMPERRPAE